MASPALSYSVITPARNDAANLQRLAECMERQRRVPLEWVIVDNGSTDETGEVADHAASRMPWTRVIQLPYAERAEIRGRPIVAAFNAGLSALGRMPDVVVKLDADVSFDVSFFERLVNAFEHNPRLGISGGTCLEQDSKGLWKPRHTTRGHVRGATRAYRAECLDVVTPLEERMGWDGIDELKAQVNGWQTATLSDLPFWHHRALGAREKSWTKWKDQGDMAHYMGYRPSYLLVRTAYRALQDPVAIAMVWGYSRAVVTREPRYSDAELRRHLRQEQGLRRLSRRIREALGRPHGRRSYP